MHLIYIYPIFIYIFVIIDIPPLADGVHVIFVNNQHISCSKPLPAFKNARYGIRASLKG